MTDLIFQMIEGYEGSLRHNGDKLRDKNGHHHSCVLSTMLRAGHSESFLAK